eukprot:2625224-Rhodomonas_salina.1
MGTGQRIRRIRWARGGRDLSGRGPSGRRSCLRLEGTRHAGAICSSCSVGQYRMGSSVHCRTVPGGEVPEIG